MQDQFLIVMRKFLFQQSTDARLIATHGILTVVDLIAAAAASASPSIQQGVGGSGSGGAAQPVCGS
jgi:hypothetical protein